MSYAPARSVGLTLATYSSIAASESSRNFTSLRATFTSPSNATPVKTVCTFPESSLRNSFASSRSRGLPYILSPNQTIVSAERTGNGPRRRALRKRVLADGTLRVVGIAHLRRVGLDDLELHAQVAQYLRATGTSAGKCDLHDAIYKRTGLVDVIDTRDALARLSVAQ